jgi:hypothetical protein
VASLPANGRENGHDLQKMIHEQLTTKNLPQPSAAPFKDSNSKKCSKKSTVQH